MTNPGQQFRNEASQKEREAVLRNDQRVRSGSTFLDHTHSEEGGRFAKPTNVIGSTPTVQYPRLPSGPWADPVQVPPEEPLGFSVEDHEPVGMIPEIQASLKAEALGDVPGVAQCGATTEAVAQSAPPEAGAERSIVSDPSDDDVEPPAPASLTPKRRER